MYVHGMMENARILNHIFPEYRVNIYTADDVSSQAIETLKTYPNVNIVEVISNGRNKFKNLFDRFLAIDDPDCSIMFSRDADSRVHVRDQGCIEDFINSDKQLHIIRDHPCHKMPIMGGLFGLRKTALKEPMRVLIDRYFQGKRIFDRKGEDQYFLRQVLYPPLKNNTLIHDDRGTLEPKQKRTAFRNKCRFFCGQVHHFDSEGKESFKYSDFKDYGIKTTDEIFIQDEPSEKTGSTKCENKSCNFLKHTRPTVSMTHCCKMCSKGRGHGALCQRFI